MCAFGIGRNEPQRERSLLAFQAAATLQENTWNKSKL